jgi:hypothetical protein
MRRALVAVSLGLAVAGAGCSGDSGSLQDYCRRGVDAICNRFFACDPQGAAQQFGSQSGCVNQFSGQCSSTTCTGGKTFDQSAADQCLAAYPSASCSDIENGVYPAVCSQVCK